MREACQLLHHSPSCFPKLITLALSTAKRVYDRPGLEAYLPPGDDHLRCKGLNGAYLECSNHLEARQHSSSPARRLRHIHPQAPSLHGSHVPHQQCNYTVSVDCRDSLA